MSGSHAKLAPSASGRWVTCPGSVALIESLPEDQRDKPNKDAMWGTACHEVLARALLEGRTPRSFVGETIVVDEPSVPMAERSFRITDEDAVNVETAYSYVRTRLAEYGPDTEVMVETKVDCGANFHISEFDTEAMEMGYRRTPVEDACSGTADVIMCGGGYIEVVDYKNGQRWVDHEGNTQLLLYLLGAMREVEPGQVQRARLTIVQPRAVVPAAPEGSPMRNAVRTWEFEEKHIIEHAVRLGVAAHAALGANAPRVAGDHCRNTFCPAQAICPELKGVAEKALTASEPAPAPVDPFKGQSAAVAPASPSTVELSRALTRNPDELTGEQLALVLSSRELIRAWLKAIEEHALACELRGEHIPGFKVVAGRRSRKWSIDDEALRKRFAQTGRIGEDGKSAGKLRQSDFLETEVLSPAQAEKRIKPLVTPKVWGNLEKLIATEDGKPTLAPETDTRPAINTPSSAEVFGINQEETAELSFLQ